MTRLTATRTVLLALPLALGSTLAVPSTAVAGCHLVDCVENVYITPKALKKKTCEDLWILRNSIFHDARYCFQTTRAMKAFGNQGCQFSDQSEVPLNDYQRTNIDTLATVEAEKGC
jgi:hypothetical protein